MTNDRGLKRKGKYSIAETFEYIDASPRNGQKINFHGDDMHMRSPNLLNFRLHGIVCVECGMRGAFFAKEQRDGNPKNNEGDALCLDLYGFNRRGEEVMMTRDHIKPRAKGGTNHLYNIQPMCFTCNQAKADVWSIKDKVRYVVSRFRHLFLPDN